jgi:signal transduction histidine kinase
MLMIYRWLTGSRWFVQPGSADGAPARAPIEVIVLRCLGLGYLVAFVVDTLTSSPHPGLAGHGPVIAAAAIVFVVAAVATQPQRIDMPVRRRVGGLLVLGAVTAVLAAEQPGGIWIAGAYFIAIMAGMRLPRVAGVLTVALSLTSIAAAAAIAHHDETWGVVGAIPWFLITRLIGEVRRQNIALQDSRAAEARNAVIAERARLAREMHDVLAHSLSALALQLESTRMLARERRVDREVAQAIDQAHHLAASGLQDARRAIATARGEELPGPERIGVLAEAFGEQSGLPVAVAVEGEPHELAPDARLAVYRTTQEALTNVRRHAAAERVEIKLAYLPDSTVLVVEDHARAGTPPPLTPGPATNGYGLTGMRERAELLGGELRAEPTDAGFRVELRLPA